MNTYSLIIQNMPNLDKTGPLGKGPMTGKKRGLCLGKTSEENKSTQNAVPGRGLGRRRRRRLLHK